MPLFKATLYISQNCLLRPVLFKELLTAVGTLLLYCVCLWAAVNQLRASRVGFPNRCVLGQDSESIVKPCVTVNNNFLWGSVKYSNLMYPAENQIERAVYDPFACYCPLYRT